MLPLSGRLRAREQLIARHGKRRTRDEREGKVKEDVWTLLVVHFFSFSPALRCLLALTSAAAIT